jgi:hypothetical protein
MTITIILLITLILDCLTAIAQVYIDQYYLHLKSQQINDFVMSLVNANQIKLFENYKSALIEHNQLCLELHNQNKIMKTLYFYVIFNIIPTNLILLHQYLFENLKFYVQFLVLFIIIIQTLAIFVFQYYFASISASIHKPFKILSRLQWNIRGWPFRMRTKIKLLTCIERLGSNRKIGFAIGSIAVMTFPLFSQVYIFHNLLIILANLMKFF